MTGSILRSLLAAAVTVATLGPLAARPAGAAVLQIPRGTEARPVRLAAADRVGRMVFARHYRPSLEDAIPERISLFREDDLLSPEDWLRQWGQVQIQQIGRPY
jgi:hypothetical protein